ncbi:unnamed protein product [Ambrosiozyma monospora]|uniref:Unnamed protein product n=1 Tax=Ambrosiozyma monospora TaxID=43982 RepID=A0A9W7DBI8_AMBMO|nr:unnamed protein product [Ambrosiozyma monospora]
MSSDSAQQEQQDQQDQQDQHEQQEQQQSSASDLPAGSLPPRKRARTEQEKEQRRVERRLRNKKAAHTSREKKKRHVEHLEKYVLDLESSSNGLYDNQCILLESQSKLIALLSKNNIDFSSIDNLDVKPIEKLERPDYLEMTTIPDANTSDQTSSNSNGKNNNKKKNKNKSSSSS